MKATRVKKDWNEAPKEEKKILVPKIRDRTPDINLKPKREVVETG